MLRSSRAVARRVAYIAIPLTAAAMSLAAGAGIASAASSSADVGLPPTAVAIDSAAHTAYVTVSDGNADQVAVVNTTSDTDVATVQLPSQSGPAAIAFDTANSTVYIAESTSGDVDAIDETTCNANTTTGCATAPTTVASTYTTPDAIAVDSTGNSDAVYVADASTGTVTVFGGATCSALVSTGCATTQTITVGESPSAIAVDPTLKSVYVANLADDTISVINETDCSSLAAACATDVPGLQTLDAGAAPLALALSLTSSTLYVAESGTSEVGLVDTATCNSAATTGCATASTTIPVGSVPDAVTVEAAGFIAVGDLAENNIKVFNGATCKTGTTSGCVHLATQTTPGPVVGLVATSTAVFAADSGNNSLDTIPSATKPTITATLKSAHAKTKYGWYRSNVTVSFKCTPGTSSLAAACPKAVVISKSAKAQKVTATVTADDGGTATVTESINLDKVKPKVSIKGVKSGATYKKAPKLTCIASDALSGIASCTISKHATGKTVYYNAKATDKAGNIKYVYGHYKLEG